MKKWLIVVYFVCMGVSVVGQQPPKLIIRSDDMGFAHSGNLALITTYQKGITTSIEVIVPSPWFPEAVQLLTQNPAVDVGIHLALTSEWDNLKWRPLTHVPSLTDADGYFYPMIWPNKNYPDMALLQHDFKLGEIEKEFRAQIELALKKIPRITHVSGHMGCTQMTPAVKELVDKLCKEYHIYINLEEKGLKPAGFAGPHKTFEEKKHSFLTMLDNLQPGNVYLFVEHPAFDDAEMRAIHHIGYENVAEDRQGVADLLTDAAVMAAIKKKNIQLISYGQL